jgi:3-oxoacyl-[acyl-carrier protein] reductase
VIVVTGASRGIGRAICERLIAKGKNVLGLARDVSDVPFPALKCDVSIHEDWERVVHKLRLDKVNMEGLVNAAGIASMNLAVTTPSATTQRLIQTNLTGTIFGCQLMSPLMFRRRQGAIINFSTIAVALGLKGESIYAASKAGVEGFTRSFAREASDFGITANCIAPGPIDTSLLKGVSAAQIAAIVSRQIIPRQFTVESVCDVVELLLDARSASITGQVLHIGGA